MSTIRANKLEHISTSNGGIQLDNAGHVQVDGVQMPTAGPLSNRNLVINGAMQVAQRGTTSTSTNNYCSLDSYRVDSNQGAWEFSQETLSSGDPYNLGFRHFARLKNTTTTTANDRRRRFLQFIEAQNVAQSGWNYVSTSSFITVSFWVRSSVAGTYYFYVQTPNNDPDQSFHFGETLAANTWTKVEKTIPGASSLTINNDTSTGFRIIFSADHGTDFTGNISLDQWITFNNNLRSPDTTTGWSSTLDATFDVTGVQLEVGEKATPFEHRSYGDELARCQRYFYAHNCADTFNMVAHGHYGSSTLFIGLHAAPVPFRAIPSLTTSGSFETAGDSASQDTTSISISDNPSGNTTLQVRAVISGGLSGEGTFLRNKNDANARFELSAEL